MKQSHRHGPRTLLVMIALAGLLMPLFSGCVPSGSSGGGSAKPSAENIVVTEKDADTTVRVSPGQTLDVVLDANPSTGYTWSVVSAPEFLMLRGEPGFSSESASGVVGAPGRQTLMFSVSATGEGSLDLSYVRPWETDTPPARTFHIEVTSE